MAITLLKTAMLASLGLTAALQMLPATAECPAPGQWRMAAGESVTTPELMAQLQDSSVVMLGEWHDRMEHHRWQLHTLAGLHARRADMVIALEMLPRQAQPALDAWVAGELDEAAFLERSRWHEAWGHDPDLYLPILHFARLNQVPLVAINVDRDLRMRLAEEGWESVPEAERFHITPPTDPPQAYRDSLAELLSAHPMGSHEGYDVDRFVAGQLVWDRAMASGLAEAASDGALVVGLIGEGHLAYGHGVPHQLEDLGVEEQHVLLPWEVVPDCQPPAESLADAVFAISANELHEPGEPLRLGILIDADEEGVRVRNVGSDSPAERAGLEEGDTITHAAGSRLAAPGDLMAVLRRLMPGTLLPLDVIRNDSVMEILVHFPTAQAE